MTGLLVVAAAILSTALSGTAKADEQADAKAILDAAIAARGGEAALSKVVGLSYKLKGFEYDGDMKTPYSAECFFAKDDKTRTVYFDADHKISEIQVVNGKEGWQKEGDQPTEKMSDAQLAEFREQIYLNWATLLVALKAKEFQLSTLEEITVADRKAVGLSVRNGNHGLVKLYFDKETRLLVQSQQQLKDSDTGNAYEETGLFSDFKTFQGVMQPPKTKVLRDGVKVADAEITEMKLFDKPMDEKLFAKP